MANSGGIVVRALSAAALYAAAPGLAGTVSSSQAAKRTVRRTIGPGDQHRISRRRHLGIACGNDRRQPKRRGAISIRWDAHPLPVALGDHRRQAERLRRLRRNRPRRRQVFTSFDVAAYKLIGSTRNYKGISGSALYSITPEPSLEQERYGYVMKHDVAWTIPTAPPLGCARFP